MGRNLFRLIACWTQAARLSALKQTTHKVLLALATVVLTAAPSMAADVQLSQFNDTPDPAVRGGEIVYSLNIENNAADTANTVQLSLPLPATTVFVSVVGTGCSHDGGSPGTITCNLGDLVGTLTGGPVATVTVILRSSAATGATLSATATVSSSSADTNGTNNSLSQTTTIDDGADLVLTKSGSPATVVAGGDVTWSVGVSNQGPNASGLITVTDTLPTNMTYLSASGSGWSCSNAGQTVTCTQASLSNGAAAPNLSIIGRVTGAVTGTLTNTATASAATSDPNPNNTVTADVTVTSGTDLSIGKTVSPNPTLSGQNAVFTLTPRNNGPFSATTVTVTDTLPAGFTYVAAAGTDWSCAESAGTVTCTTATYAVGATNNITITTIAPTVPGVTAATNSAVIASSTADPTSSNNTATLHFNVVPDGVDLGLTKTKTPNPVAQNANMTSTLTVHNYGPQAAASGTITVTDTLDVANEEYVSFSGTDWSCSFSSPVVSCTYNAALANGANAAALSITTKASGTGSLANSAAVNYSGTPGDWNIPNNSVSASVTSTPSGLSADLSITKTATAGGDATLGTSESDINYTLTVSNIGPGQADGIRVTDAIPGYITGTGVSVGTIVVSGTSTAALSCTTGATVTCSQTSGLLNVGDTVTIPVTVSRPMNDGVLNNSATVNSTTLGDPDRSNNTSTTTSITVEPIADVQMQTKTVTPATVKAGVNATYVMTYRNNGPSSAQGVEVVDIFTVPGSDAGFTVVSIATSKSGSSCTGLTAGSSYAAGTHTLICTIGTLTSGQSETVTLVVRPNWQTGTAVRALNNTASITTTTWENTAHTDNGNNSQSASLIIDPADVDMLVNTSDNSPAGPDPLGYDPATPANNIIVYRVAITNRGPSLATGVVFNDTITPPVGKTITFIGSGTTAADAATNAAAICTNVGTTSGLGAALATTCTLGSDMAANTSVDRYLAFRVEMAPAAGGETFVNSVTIDANETDSNAANDTEAETTTVRVRSDIAVSKSTSVSPVQLRQPFYWTITVSNNGPGDSEQTTLSDTLPAGMSFFTPAQASTALSPYNGVPYNAGPVWSNTNATPASGSCTTVGQALACDFGRLESGRVVTVTVPVRITTYAASYTNSASAATSEVDPNSANNTGAGSVNVQRSSLGGYVYRDLNNDAAMLGAGETGIGGTSNITLTGTDDYGNSVNTTVSSAASGTFSFTNLSPSTTGLGGGYTVTETQPAGFYDGKETAGTSGGTAANTGFDNTAVNNRITAISLIGNTAATGYLFGELPGNVITGYVYVDADNDGVKDAGETTGIAGATVTLSGTDYGADGVSGTADDAAASATTTTNATGAYGFTNLRAGNYTVTETQPASYLDGKDAAGTSGGSTAVNDAISGIVISTFGVTASANNFGELVPAQISGTVFIDLDNDGIRDAGETGGVPGVTITLTGTDDLGNPVSTTTTTDGSGNYSFTGLRPGSYTVTETPPAGLTHTGAEAGTAGGTGGVGTSVTGILLSSGTTATGYNFGASGQGLSGYVYVDLNNNGTKDAGEPGIPGVGVTLSGTTVGSVNVCLAIAPNPCSVTTGSDGGYSFVGLPASNATGYTVTEQSQAAVPLSNYTDGAESLGTLGGAIAAEQFTGIVQNVGQFGTGYNFGEHGASLTGRVYHDTDDDGIFTAADSGIGGVTVTLSGTTASGADVCSIIPSCTVTTAADGSYSFAGLPAGTYTLTEAQPFDYADRTTSAGTPAGTVTGTIISGITLSAGQVGSGYLFGEKTGSLSGSVYYDTNNDGVKDAGENGIAGVTLTLTGSSVGGTAINQTVTTAADGSYSFTDLKNANGSGYTITETQPGVYLDGKETAGTQTGTVDNTSFDATPAKNRISTIPFSAVAAATGYNFGEVQSGGLSGRVYHDANGNGSYDAGEELAGVTLTLTGTDDQGQAVSQAVITAADGSYSFTNLRPSNATGYTVTETQPNGIADTGADVGSLGGSAGINLVSGIVLLPGQNGTGYNFRENASSLSGSVYLDANDNGSRDGGETGIAGVVITLTGIDANGAAVNRTTTTATDGSYRFIGLTSGSYILTETHPVIYQDGRETAGTAGGTADNTSFTTASAQNLISGITLPAGTAGSGYLFGERDGLAASLSGKVWYNSELSDQMQQVGEPGQSGWVVQVVQSGTVIATTTSAADGSYSFTSLPSGTGYEIRFRHPVSGALYGKPVSQDATYVDSTVDYSNFTIANLTLRSGANVTEQNLPIDPSGVVYDAITRQPVSGATVTINGPAGFDPATHLAGGTGNLSQVTDATGYYQFLLLPGAPAGTYALAVTPPAAYTPGVSTIIPPTNGPFNPGTGPSSVEIQPQAAPPTGTQLTTYYLSFTLSGASAGVVHNHIPVDPILGGALLVTKTTPKVNVTRGELVPYTITARNTLAATLSNIDLLDLLPPGFKYRSGSARLNGVAVEPAMTGRSLRWPGQIFSPSEVKTLTLVLVVGSGVGEGTYTNQAWAMNNLVNSNVSNVAQAGVRIVPDPTFDCTDIVGKVFDDTNINGYQDQGESGIPNIRIATAKGWLVTTDADGRFHVPCAVIPREDRGANFIMKLDERTLPSGYRVTTENPRVVRATRGKMVKLNFGAAIHRVVRVEVNAEAFEHDAVTLKEIWMKRFVALPDQLKERPSLVRLVYRQQVQHEPLAQDRLDGLIRLLRRTWEDHGGRYPLSVEAELLEVSK